MDSLKVSISQRNSKMGNISSISLPPIITCSKEACKFCGKKCYAKKICRLRKSVRDAYQRNLDIFLSNPDSYWAQVNGYVAGVRFFRFSVKICLFLILLRARKTPTDEWKSKDMTNQIKNHFPSLCESHR